MFTCEVCNNQITLPKRHHCICGDCLKETKNPQAAGDKCSAELACSVADVSQEMMNAGMTAAVRAGLVPEHAGEIDYLNNWNGIKAIIGAALLAKH